MDSGKKLLGTIPMPNAGLSIENLLNIGATLSLYAQTEATLTSELDFAVDLDYTISNARLFFPPVNETFGVFQASNSGTTTVPLLHWH